MNILHWLTVLFVGLKLTGHIDWNWLAVGTPFLINVLFVAAFAAFKRRAKRRPTGRPPERKRDFDRRMN